MKLDQYLIATFAPQLLTGLGIWDEDYLLLNTAGALMGDLLYGLLKVLGVNK